MRQLLHNGALPAEKGGRDQIVPLPKAPVRPRASPARGLPRGPSPHLDHAIVGRPKAARRGKPWPPVGCCQDNGMASP